MTFRAPEESLQDHCNRAAFEYLRSRSGMNYRGCHVYCWAATGVLGLQLPTTSHITCPLYKKSRITLYRPLICCLHFERVWIPTATTEHPDQIEIEQTAPENGFQYAFQNQTTKKTHDWKDGSLTSSSAHRGPVTSKSTRSL